MYIQLCTVQQLILFVFHTLSVSLFDIIVVFEMKVYNTFNIVCFSYFICLYLSLFEVDWPGGRGKAITQPVQVQVYFKLHLRLNLTFFFDVKAVAEPWLTHYIVDVGVRQLILFVFQTSSASVFGVIQRGSCC